MLRRRIANEVYPPGSRLKIGFIWPRSTGCGEVSPSLAAYAGLRTDHDVYIRDTGNGRTLRVKLSCHAAEKVKLPGAKDAP